MRVFEVWGDLIRDGIARLKRAWPWMVAQFVGLALLISLGLLWTRIPEKYSWQVALTFVLPAAMLYGFLVLQAGTLRAWLRPEVADTTEEATDSDDEEAREPRRVWLGWGALTLVLWIALGWAAWIGLDRADAQTYQWAAYLNSKLSPHARATWGSFDHMNRDLESALWALRWIVVPGLLIPLACCTAAWGLLRTPWRRGLRVLARWKWWPVVAIWALLGEAWPQTWFNGEPHGTVHAQVWRVLLKLAGAYLLAVLGWNKALGWSAMLVDPRPRTMLDEPYLRLGLSGPATPSEIVAPVEEEPDTIGRSERRPFLGLGLTEEPTPAEPAAPIENEPAAEIGSEPEPPSSDGIVGRPLPKGGEDAGGNA